MLLSSASRRKEQEAKVGGRVAALEHQLANAKAKHEEVRRAVTFNDSTLVAIRADLAKEKADALAQSRAGPGAHRNETKGRK